MQPIGSDTSHNGGVLLSAYPLRFLRVAAFNRRERGETQRSSKQAKCHDSEYERVVALTGISSMG